MSTRSNIGILRRTGKVEIIYCHNDGYLSYNGKILLKNYKDINTINEMLELGDMSYLGKTLEESFFYGKDRGEENTKKIIYDNLEEYFKKVDNLFIEYIYIFSEDKEKWYYIGTIPDIKNKIDNMEELTEEAIRNEE